MIGTPCVVAFMVNVVGVPYVIPSVLFDIETIVSTVADYINN